MAAYTCLSSKFGGTKSVEEVNLFSVERYFAFICRAFEGGFGSVDQFCWRSKLFEIAYINLQIWRSWVNVNWAAGVISDWQKKSSIHSKHKRKPKEDTIDQ